LGPSGFGQTTNDDSNQLLRQDRRPHLGEARPRDQLIIPILLFAEAVIIMAARTTRNKACSWLRAWCGRASGTTRFK
jgi:hypothetical protein